MDENVVLCAVCSWREVCKKKYSVSGIEIFNCPDFSRDVSISISGIEELMQFINNFKSDRMN